MSSKASFPDDASESSSNALSRQDSFVSFTSNKAVANKQWESALRSSSSTMEISSPKKPAKKTKSTTSSSTVTQQPHYKAGRVKVGIRCRPAFQDEIDFAQGNFFSIVDCKFDGEQSSLGRVSLTLLSGKQRDFLFDYVFDSNSTQG